MANHDDAKIEFSSFAIVSLQEMFFVPRVRAAGLNVLGAQRACRLNLYNFQINITLSARVTMVYLSPMSLPMPRALE